MAKQRQTKRYKASDQEKQAANELQRADDVNIMALHERLGKVCRKRWLLRRHRDEVQKDVRAKDDEHEPKEHADGDGGNFHGAMLYGSGDISITKTANR